MASSEGDRGEINGTSPVTHAPAGASDPAVVHKSAGILLSPSDCRVPSLLDLNYEPVRTVPWPVLNDVALFGALGEIVATVAPHTEADPAAILVQLLGVFGATVGGSPHFVAGSERQQAVIHPLVVGRTNNGAKGTSLAVVDAIRVRALPEFSMCVASGLSSAEGLIELVRDASGAPGDAAYVPGVADKRLLVTESEYKSVLVRQRRGGNTLAQTLRDSWDGRTLRTLNRKRHRLTATRPHIVVIGHVTPGEFRATLKDSDISGGSVNRLLICLSRRRRLDSRFGNIPDRVLEVAAQKFRAAHDAARERGELQFSRDFLHEWDRLYPELTRDRPDCQATDATARGVIQILRLSLLYALFDNSDDIDVEHLEAAEALWAYAEHSARWLFSNHDEESKRESVDELATFILQAGSGGRTRTEISRGFYKGNKPATEINADLEPLVHDGVVMEIKEATGVHRTLRYVHSAVRNHESTKTPEQEADLITGRLKSVRFDGADNRGTGMPPSRFVASSSEEIASELGDFVDSSIRSGGLGT